LKGAARCVIDYWASGCEYQALPGYDDLWRGLGLGASKRSRKMLKPSPRPAGISSYYAITAPAKVCGEFIAAERDYFGCHQVHLRPRGANQGGPSAGGSSRRTCSARWRPAWRLNSDHRFTLFAHVGFVFQSKR
jgi:hypothetical protein